MITEQYVEFSTAKLLKEKGFNEDCMFVVNLDSNGILPCSFGTKNSEIDNKNIVTIPSQSLVMRWLREVHHITIVCMPYAPFQRWAPHPDGEADVVFMIQLFNGIIPLNRLDSHITKLTYEEAIESAIKYCLENLI